MQRMGLYVWFLTFVVCGNAQTPKDIWLMGYEEYPVSWYGHTMLEIAKGETKVAAASLGMNFDQTMAVWQDSSGALRLYTNGCAVATGDGSILTDALNPGDEREILCPQYGYTVEGGALFLDDPAGEGKIILVHHGLREDTKAIHLRDKLYFSRFQLSESGAEVVSENELVVDAPMERFIAVRHGNGRDWWLLCPGLLSEKWFVILLHPEGYTLTIQDSGVSDLDTSSCIRGMPSLAASPDGSMIARWNPNCRLRVYTWDRCEGRLEYQYERFAEQPQWRRWGVGSTVFSPSGRYIYTNNHLTVYRLDTWSDTPKLDTKFTASSHWGTPLNQMGVAANGNIYISQIASDTNLSIIMFPDAPGNFTFFFPRGLSVGRLYRGTMPVTVYRNAGPLAGSPCDTMTVSIEPPFDQTSMETERMVQLIPNPARDEVYVKCGNAFQARNYQIVDPMGRIQLEGSIPPDHRLSLWGLSPGWYMFMINPQSDDWVVLKLVISP
jgi:hypothetical protein